MRPAEVAAPIRDTREAGAQKCPEQTGAKDAKMKVVTFYAIGLRMPNRRGDAGGVRNPFLDGAAPVSPHRPCDDAREG